MIGNPKWFRRRKYGGWGITPDSWQGWVYIVAVIVPYAIFNALPYWDERTRTMVTVIWLGFLLFDVTDIMIRMNRDEREVKHEAIAERNASWAMVLVLAVGLVYQIIRSGMQNGFQIDPFLAAALFGGAIVKSLSNYYLRNK